MGTMSSDLGECTVCSQGFQGKILSCGHVFHVSCIDSWLNDKGTCPNCRTSSSTSQTSLTTETKECSICLEYISVARKLPCGHGFHMTCLYGKRNCPQCDASFEEIFPNLCLFCKKSVILEDKNLPCGHIFHELCVTAWLNDCNSCPECSSQVDPNLPFLPANNCTTCNQKIILGEKSLPCGHKFHESCISKWVEECNTCPDCCELVDPYKPLPAADKCTICLREITTGGRDLICGHKIHDSCLNSIPGGLDLCQECLATHLSLEVGFAHEICLFCLQEIGDSNLILTCGHKFHHRCISPWLIEQKICPECLAPITVNVPLQPNPHESIPAPISLSILRQAISSTPSTSEGLPGVTASSTVSAVTNNQMNSPLKPFPLTSITPSAPSLVPAHSSSAGGATSSSNAAIQANKPISLPYLRYNFEERTQSPTRNESFLSHSSEATDSSAITSTRSHMPMITCPVPANAHCRLRPINEIRTAVASNISSSSITQKPAVPPRPSTLTVHGSPLVMSSPLRLDHLHTPFMPGHLQRSSIPHDPNHLQNNKRHTAFSLCNITNQPDNPSIAQGSLKPIHLTPFNNSTETQRHTRRRSSSSTRTNTNTTSSNEGYLSSGYIKSPRSSREISISNQQNRENLTHSSHRDKSLSNDTSYSKISKQACSSDMKASFRGQKFKSLSLTNLNSNPTNLSLLQEKPRGKTELSCSFCFNVISNNGIDLKCGHKFHSTCIEPWLEKYKTCSVCSASCESLESDIDEDAHSSSEPEQTAERSYVKQRRPMKNQIPKNKRTVYRNKMQEPDDSDSDNQSSDSSQSYDDEDENEVLKRKIKNLKLKDRLQQRRLEQMEENQRKRNLIFKGFRDLEPNQYKDTVCFFCAEVLGIDVSDFIETVFPIGRKNVENLQLKVVFQTAQNASDILARCSRLRGTDFFVTRDYPKNVRIRRNKLLHCRYEIMKRTGLKNVSVRDEILVVENRKFVWDKEMGLVAMNKKDEGFLKKLVGEEVYSYIKTIE